jgi:NTE family protein
MKLGVALAGGGARGAYQIGAWKALEEHKLFDQIEAFSGASVGSLNAVLFAMGDFDLAYRTWMSLDKDSLFNLEKHILRRIFKEKLTFLNRGVYSTRRLERLLEETVDFTKIENKEVFVATTHLGNHNSTFFDLLNMNYKHFFKEEQQIRYIDMNKVSEKDKKSVLMASCAIPVAFKPVEIENETYYDGGLLDNTPYQPLIDAGCDKIIVIDLFTFSPMRIRKITDSKVYTVYPRKSLRGILDFNKKHTERRYLLGYQDMNKLLEKIKDDLV